MADLEASKLNLVNFKLISQMVSNSDVAGRLYWNIKKKQKLTSIFFGDVRCLIIIIVCLYVCLCVFVHKNMFLYVSNKYDAKINKGKK